MYLQQTLEKVQDWLKEKIDTKYVDESNIFIDRADSERTNPYIIITDSDTQEEPIRSETATDDIISSIDIACAYDVDDKNIIRRSAVENGESTPVFVDVSADGYRIANESLRKTTDHIRRTFFDNDFTNFMNESIGLISTVLRSFPPEEDSEGKVVIYYIVRVSVRNKIEIANQFKQPQ